MSGTETAFIVGLISGAISIIEAIKTVYDAAKDAQGQPEAFRQVAARLPLVIRILHSARERAQALDETAQEALEPTLESCKAKAETLQKIFQKVIRKDDDKWYDRYKKTVGTLGKQGRVEALMEGILKDIHVLVSEKLIGTATDAEVKEIKEAMKQMKDMPSSLPDETADALQQQHSGSGDNIGATGGSVLSLHKGTGNQYHNEITGDAYFGGGSPNSIINVINMVKRSERRLSDAENRPCRDFGFRGPVGIYLYRAPYIASELFVGRDYELDQIAKLLHPDHKAGEQRRLILGGMGGIGKTQLAIAYAKSGRGSYSSVFWLNAVSETTLKESFRCIASHIFDVGKLRTFEDQEIVSCVHQWLCTPENTGWLLIFDNYDDPAHFQIDRYYPTTHGAIMVTTRRPDLVAGTPLQIDPLKNVEDSLTILQTRSEREKIHSDPHAQRLAERLAGFPLALATAGTYLRSHKVTFEDYLQDYERRWVIDPRRPLQLQEYQERTLYTTWDMSYSRLEKEDPDAAKFLKLLAYFDNQRLWYELFHAGLTDNSPRWLREVITDDVNFKEVMGVLVDYYFLEAHQTSPHSWSMHNCVHDWTLATLNKNIDERHYWYAFDCISAYIRDESTTVDFANLSFFHLAAHASRLVQQRFYQNDNIYNITPYRLHQARQIASLLRGQEQLPAAEQMYQRVLAGYEKALGANHTFTLNAMNNLGFLYEEQEKSVQAEHMFQRILAAKEKALGANHSSTLDSVNILGLLYQLQGKLDLAEQMHQRALAGFRKVVGANYMSTLSTINNLGLLYQQQGKLNQAEQMYRQALAGFEKGLGADHPLTLTTTKNIGLLYQDQGNLRRAEQIYQQAVARYEKALGADLDTVNHLGVLSWKQGKLDKAEQMFQRVLATKRNLFGANHTSTLDTVNILGVLHQKQGELDQAEQMHQQALAGFRKALEANYTSSLITVNNLGLLYQQQGKLNQAEQMYRQALAGFERALGADHTLTLTAAKILGLLYQAQGKLDQAEQMHQKALAGFEKALGADHRSTLDTVNLLGVLYRDRGELDKAEQMRQRALAEYEKALRADHTTTLSAVKNIGLLYYDQPGKLDQAHQMFQRLLAGYEKALGADHGSTLNIINILGDLYRKQGKLDQAEQMFQRALTGYEQALGANHPSTLATMNVLGVLYQTQGKLDQAEKMHQRALAGYEQALGANHPSTLNTMNVLGILYQRQGKLDQAEKMHQRALTGYEQALGANHPSTLATIKALRVLLGARQATQDGADVPAGASWVR